MTGNGKTGLCIGLLEEAATDGIPAIAIDPKGDIANLLLTFPELRPSDFRPWVSEDEARVKESAPTSWPLNRPSFGKTDSPLSSRMARDQAAAGRGDGNYLHSGQRSGRAAKY
jgi:DNA helicase HerA-like ATPase